MSFLNFNSQTLGCIFQPRDSIVLMIIHRIIINQLRVSQQLPTIYYMSLFSFCQILNKNKTNQNHILGLPKDTVFKGYSSSTGQLNNNLPHGFCKLEFPNTQKFEGQYLNGLKNGKGKYFYQNGELYIGNWKNNKKEGKGQYFYANGQRYEGYQLQKGEFSQNLKHGQGRIYQANGQNYFSGNFYKNKKHLYGYYHDVPNNRLIKQYWYEGVLKEQWNQGEEEKTLDTATPLILDSKLNFLEFMKKHQSIQSQCYNNQSQSDCEKRHNTLAMVKFDSGKFDSYGSNGMGRKSIQKNVYKWNDSDVCEWLTDNNFSQYISQFKQHKILGKHLLCLQSDSLKQLGIKTIGHRRNFEQKLKRLKKDVIQKYYKKNVSKKLQNIGTLFKKNNNNEMKKNFNGNTNKNYKQDNLPSDDIQTSLPRNNQSQCNLLLIASSSSDQESDLQQQKKNKHPNIQRKLSHYLQKNGIQLHFLIEGNIQFKQEIGRGASGKVYLGKWLKQEVAIKKYSKKVHNRHLGTFVQQVRLISRLFSPHIVLYMGIYIKDNQYSMITQYLQKGSLYDHLHKNKTLIDNQKMISIVEDIVLGMIYLHGRNVLHCDLKSSNVLIDQSWNVKLCDFGLSGILASENRRKMIGTPHWMAPQIIRGQKYQKSADIYSFGIIIWQLLTRKIPYSDLTITQIIGVVGYSNKKLTKPTGNTFLVDLFEMCTRKEAKERPSSFEQIHKMIQKHKAQLKQKSTILKDLQYYFGINQQ